MKNIYQIQIVLKESSPRIWRKILVPSDFLLSDFHKILQTVMGWTNSHLHQFIKNDTFYTLRMEDDDTWEELNNVDYKSMKISDLLKTEKELIIYEYDFGDSWMHQLTLEKILPLEKNIKYPVCLSGKMNCPPEDVGGIWGYANMCKILKEPGHEEYKSYIEWLGDKFDPEFFDLPAVNEMLQEKDFGCLEL